MVGAGLLFFVVALVVAGVVLIQQPEPRRPDPTTDIERVIRRYNDLLVQGYRSLNMTQMNEVATKLQAEDEYIHMSSMAEGGVRLDPELTKFEFLSASIESTTAVAETRETWDYRHYSRESGDLVLEQEDLVYHLAWDLEKQSDGSWLVSDVRAISATATADPSAPGTLPPTHPGR